MRMVTNPIRLGEMAETDFLPCAHWEILLRVMGSRFLMKKGFCFNCNCTGASV